MPKWFRFVSYLLQCQCVERCTCYNNKIVSPINDRLALQKVWTNPKPDTTPISNQEKEEQVLQLDGVKMTNIKGTVNVNVEISAPNTPPLESISPMTSISPITNISATCITIPSASNLDLSPYSPYSPQSIQSQHSQPSPSQNINVNPTMNGD